MGGADKARHTPGIACGEDRVPRLLQTTFDRGKLKVVSEPSTVRCDGCELFRGDGTPRLPF